MNTNKADQHWWPVQSKMRRTVEEKVFRDTHMHYIHILKGDDFVNDCYYKMIDGVKLPALIRSQALIHIFNNI